VATGRQLRLGAAQFGAVGGDVAANVGAHVTLLEEAARRSVDLLVFPELSLTGYAADRLVADARACALDPASPLLAPLRAACRRHRIAALAGAPVLCDGRLRLSALLFDRRGALAHIYEKQFLDGAEKDWFAPGEAGVLLEVHGRRLGVGICYDASFPEHARRLALAGAEAYLVSGAFPLGVSDFRRGVYFPARALENTVYVVFANYVGGHGGLGYGGRSAVYGPDGRLIDEASAEAPGLAVAAVDPQVLAAAREAATMLRDLAPAVPVASVRVA
jgi:predicted amidohydrolase